MTDHSLGAFVQRHRAGALEIPEGHELRVVVDNDHVSFMVHPGYDADGEELGDPQYHVVKPNDPQELLVEALRLLGLPAEGA